MIENIDYKPSKIKSVPSFGRIPYKLIVVVAIISIIALSWNSIQSAIVNAGFMAGIGFGLPKVVKGLKGVFIKE